MIEIEIIIEITEMMIIAEEVITEGINGIIIEGVTIGLMADGIEVIGIEAVTGEFKLAIFCAKMDSLYQIHSKTLHSTKVIIFII